MEEFLMSTSFSHVFIEELTNNLNPKITRYFSDNKDSNKFFSQSLHEMVNSLVQSELANYTERDALKSLYSKKMRLRRSKKARYLKRCSDMIDTEEYKNGSDKYFLRATLIQYSLTPEDKRNLVFDGQSFKSIEQAKLEDIKEWSEDDYSLMIEYPGEDKLTSTAVIGNYKNDVLIDILLILQRQYNFDLRQATYAVLEELKNQPLFAAKNNIVNVGKADGTDIHEITIYKDGEKNKDKALKITFSSRSVKNGVIKILDQTDNQILSYLLSAWDSRTPVTSSTHSIKVIDLLRYIKPNRNNYSSTDYKTMIERVEKIYDIGVKNINKETTNKGMHIISAYEYNPITRIITYAFDPFYMNEFHNIRIRKMSSKPLMILTNNVSKILYSSFMDQRHNAYKAFRERNETPDAYVIPFAYNYLLYWCNFGEENKKRSYHDDIIDALEDFKQHDILIKDYVYLPTKKIYKITFFPLSEDEIKDFDYYYNVKELPLDETLDETLDTNLFIPTIED